MILHYSFEDTNCPYLFLDNSEQIAELPTDFINFLALSPKNRAQGTIKLYAGRLKDFCVFLELHPVYGQVKIDQAIRSLKMIVIDEFYRYLITSGLGASTVRGCEVVVKLLAEWLTTEFAGRVHEKSLYHNVSYRTPTPYNRMPRYLVPDEIIQLSCGLHWEIQRLIIHFIYDTGVRVEEVTRILKSDIPSTDNCLEGQEYFAILIRGVKGRGGVEKDRYTIISRPVIARLNRYFKTRTYMYADKWAEDAKPALLNVYGEKLTKIAIQKFISDAAKRCGIKKKVSAHRLRHGTAYSVLKNRSDGNFLDSLLLVQKMLGHADIKTTEIYTHIPAPVLQQQIQVYGKAGVLMTRVEESERIFESTYLKERELPPLKKIGLKNE
ncbi:hypothetical protein C3Y98_08790 [Methylotenera oryzisoli]|uniref:Tyr recombinase domain-containing protein n=1 Tax=Methylotenera oryzisoli TaxID=2080758 RepID=A0A4Y9VQ20_9PROT|nr:tyrosine-type recombinase/integrase [Methylotenera oryzisoli]TFW70762.1 hypothetical protein C3Y98_08790 [Methylotenera oryzisoli]